MKKLLSTALFLCFSSLSANSEVICNSKVSTTNVRKGPGAKSFPVIAELNNGSEVDVIKKVTNPEGFDWAKIVFKANGEEEEQIGFVMAIAVAETCADSVSSDVSNEAQNDNKNKGRTAKLKSEKYKNCLFEFEDGMLLSWRSYNALMQLKGFPAVAETLYGQMCKWKPKSTFRLGGVEKNGQSQMEDLGGGQNSVTVTVNGCQFPLLFGTDAQETKFTSVFDHKKCSFSSADGQGEVAIKVEVAPEPEPSQEYTRGDIVYARYEKRTGGLLGFSPVKYSCKAIILEKLGEQYRIEFLEHCAFTDIDSGDTQLSHSSNLFKTRK